MIESGGGREAVMCRLVVVFSNRVVAQYIHYADAYVQELVLQMWAYAIQCININVSKQS